MGTAHRESFHFDLRIGRDAEGCFARVESSPTGEGAVRLDLEGFLPWIERLDLAAGSCRNLVPVVDLALPPTLRGEAERVGRGLGKAIFQGDVGRCFDGSLSEARHAKRRLAIRLRVDEDPLLLRFPWEAMFGPGGRSPLATSAETPLLRIVPVEGASAPKPTVAHLRVLVVTAQPRGLQQLDVEKEVEGLQAVSRRRWFGPAVDFQVLRGATAAALRQELERGGYHVVHFIGHGLPPVEGREGLIALQTEQNDQDLLSGQRLAAILGLGSEASKDLRLVVLNACHGAETEPLDGFAGVAQRLLAQGLSAVVAMRYAISDRAAIEFSKVFYRRLARGETVATAISRARDELHSNVPDCSWLKPVLFQRARESGVVLRAGWGRRACVAALALAFVGLSLLASWLGRDPYRGLPPQQPLAADFFVDDPRCPSPEGLALGFVYIEKGDLVMGSDEMDEEKPPLSVRISEPFCLAKTEVTVAQWNAVMSDGSRGLGVLRALPDGDLPKGLVSLEEVRELVARLNRVAGDKVFFLPSEAQWEYAARAGSPGRYSFEDSAEYLPRLANCGHGSAVGRARPRRVGSYSANAFGLYDMHGNLSEWVDDPYEFYRPLAQMLPPRAEAEWVRRGGSYDSNADTCRSAARASSQPETRRATYGFRIARWPVSSSAPSSTR